MPLDGKHRVSSEVVKFLGCTLSALSIFYYFLWMWNKTLISLASGLPTLGDGSFVAGVEGSLVL